MAADNHTTIVGLNVCLPIISAWGHGKRRTRLPLGRSPRRWSGAPSYSAPTSPHHPKGRGQRRAVCPARRHQGLVTDATGAAPVA